MLYGKGTIMIFKTLQQFFQGKSALMYLISSEEDRVELLLRAAADQAGLTSTRILTWSCVASSDGDWSPDIVCDPVACLAHFVGLRENAILIFKDLHLLIEENPQLIRQLKECSTELRNSRKKIFFVSPRLVLPDELVPFFKIEDVPLPRFDELLHILKTVIEGHPSSGSLKKTLTRDLRDKIVRAASGFTATEASDAFETAFMNQESITLKAVDAVLEEKEALVRKSGVLEYVSTRAGSWQIGGLVNLKKWLNERNRAFSPDAAKHGLTPPKGVLVMGISGCGKSLCIKAIASQWKLPLLRLDMGKLYDGLAGQPEEAMRNAIKTAEAVAPCVLWIDEIEAGIANQNQKQAGGKEARVLALFLTWMQEKTSPVFVGATANEVEVLPPELMRKGRFDELFYMGLPLKDERLQILSIHMKRRKVDPARFDMEYLAESTEGLNGAEIEQGVISAIFESTSKNVELTEHVLANSLRSIVPLSRTMRERIQKIEAWARDRAQKASLETL
jgi:SpoVK/Ycf46/Vps4 family AAA+-type ATPase